MAVYSTPFALHHNNLCLPIVALNLHNHRRFSTITKYVNSSKPNHTTSICVPEHELMLMNVATVLHSLDLTNPDQCVQSYALILRNCRKLHNLQLGLQLHGHMIVTGVDLCEFLGSQLLEFYCKLGTVDDTRKLFDEMSERNVFSWTSVIGLYSELGDYEEVISLFYMMIDQGVRPDHFVFPKVFKACAQLRDYKSGKDVYDYMTSIGFEGNNSVKRAFLDMFLKCGRMDIARRLFEQMDSVDVVMWNMMVSGYVSKRDFERALRYVDQMRLKGVMPDRVTYNTILSGLAQVGRFKEAAKYFSKMDGFGELEPNIVSWTALITGNLQNGSPSRALNIFRKMMNTGIKPNSTTISSAISACTSLCLERLGKEIHGYCIKTEELDSNLVVNNALIDFYSKSQNVNNGARKNFNNIQHKDLVSWNSILAAYATKGCRDDVIKLLYEMELQGFLPDVITWNGLITGFTQYGDGKTALEFFAKMCQLGVSPNTTSISGILTACAQSKNLKMGKEIHNYTIRNGIEMATGVGSALIAMYSGCDDLEASYAVFNGLSTKDVVIWNSLIAASGKSGFGVGALDLLREMKLNNAQPDSVTMISVLTACSKLAALRQGREIHQYIIRHGLDSSNFVCNALIDMYGRCGAIYKSRQVFDLSVGQRRDIVSWNVMIAAYGMHGFGTEALKLFKHMTVDEGTRPNHVTFTNLLSACSHSGLITEGRDLFDLMKQEYALEPDMEQYACMVDLMARSGQLSETLEFIEKMPFEANAAIWGSLLGACRIHLNLEMAEHAARFLFELEPESSGNYILLANIYSSLGRWEDASRIRCLMKERGVTKSPGCSWIEVGRKVYSFVVGDTSHPFMDQISAKMQSLYTKIKEKGYVPDTKFVLQNMEEAEKEMILCGHSEKLALAFGLISASGSSLRIIKNLRVCGDCHSAMKYISAVEKREIIMRDNYRFHHFVDGVCSCGDYW
ncbi:putative tetratricopeptide-like helical domain superfamily, DYW domain-containing protein [Helianthus debilis subsp. tardiflorus]